MFIVHFDPQNISDKEKTDKIKKFKEIVELTFIKDDYKLWQENINDFFDDNNNDPSIVKKIKTDINVC